MARRARLAMAEMRALEEEKERHTLSNPLRGKGQSAASAQKIRSERLAMADSRALEEEQERANPVRGRGATPSLGLSQFRGGLSLAADLATMPSGEYDGELLSGQGKHTLIDHIKDPLKGFGKAHADGARLAEAIRSQHGGAYLKRFVGGMNTGRYEGEGSHSDEEEEMEDDVAEMAGGGFLSSLGIPVVSDIAGMFGLGTGGKRLTKAALRKQLLAIKQAHPEKAAEVDAYLKRLGGRGRMAGGGFLDSLMSFISSFFGSKTKPAPPPSAPAVDRAEDAKSKLAAMGITSQKDFAKWALRNHPDKGGDTAKFQTVSDLAGRAFKGQGRARRAPASASDGRRARAAIVKKVMAEQGLSMIAASKFVKEHNLY
jgi:hypothetical protein